MNPRLTRRLGSLFIAVAAFFLGIVANRSGWFPQPTRLPPRQLEHNFEPFWDAWSLAHEHHVRALSTGDAPMTHGAIRGVLESLGDSGHTTYLSAEQIQELRDSLDGMENGIGASLGRQGNRAMVVGVPACSPAESAGLRAGDTILTVDGNDVRGLSPDDLRHRLHGPPGSVVHLRVARNDGAGEAELAIVRRRYEAPVVSWEMVPGEPIAHMGIQRFARHTGEQLRETLREVEKKRARGIILDLRGNPGGLRSQAISAASAFLGDGAVLLEVDSRGRQRTIPVIGGEVATNLPLVVLVDGKTASAAEIVAAALQDHRRATIVGTRTFGTGTMLQSFSLSDGSAVLLGVTRWLPPGGEPIWHKGLVPDIECRQPPGVVPLHPDMNYSETLAKTDNQLSKAVEVLRECLSKE
jgi:carboxyl-terminal processing protease